MCNLVPDVFQKLMGTKWDLDSGRPHPDIDPVPARFGTPTGWGRGGGHKNYLHRGGDGVGVSENW